ncbi:MAG: GspH/FimT family protein [Candidatus Sedimenticola sp. (ex Thyasira tokunagai)]
MIRNNCIVTYNNAMISGVQLARSEAAKRRAPVRVSALNSSDGGNEWGPGLRIWQDANSDDTFDAGESIREIELSCGQTTMDETSGITEFIYDSTGDVDTVSSVEICDDRSGEQGSQITISPIGRPSSTSITCS